MDSPATIEDVANRWRPLTDLEQITAATLLDDAWLLIKVKNSTVETRLTGPSPTLDVGLVVLVQCAMVIRVLRNPDGKRQEQIEDYSYQRGADDTGGLFINDDELALLDEVASTSTAFTIRPWHDPAITATDNPLDAWS